MKLDQEKYWIILVLIAVIAFWAGGRDFNFSTQEIPAVEVIGDNSINSKDFNIKDDEIIVHIGGEVNNPGVFSFSQGIRLIDAISVAGGETSKAALDQINLARVINDGEHIIIPSYLSSEAPADYSQLNTQIQSGGQVNINTAGIEELSSLAGIGRVRAEAIIEYRDNNNGFKNPEEIKNVAGIGVQTYNNIKDDIKI